MRGSEEVDLPTLPMLDMKPELQLPNSPTDDVGWVQFLLWYVLGLGCILLKRFSVLLGYPFCILWLEDARLPWGLLSCLCLLAVLGCRFLQVPSRIYEGQKENPRNSSPSWAHCSKSPMIPIQFTFFLYLSESFCICLLY